MAGQRRVKHVPLRTCVGCHAVNVKRELVRLVRAPAGGVEVDPTGKAAGRGAYLHAQRACWVQALDRRTLDQALKLSLTDADRARLRAHGEQYSDDEAAA